MKTEESQRYASALREICEKDGPGCDGSPGGVCYDIAKSALRRPVELSSPLRWTKEKPNKPGYYWRHRSARCDAQVFRVFEIPGKEWFVNLGCGTCSPLYSFEGGEWAGPIPRPE